MSKDPLVDFQGKVVAVSGASSGIGQAIANALGRHGAKLILIGRNGDRLEETSKQLGSAKNWLVQVDLANHEEIAPAILKIVKKSGPVYGLCHSAGIVEMLPLGSSKSELLRPMIDVNLLAGIELARVICRREVMEPGGGSILFLSSIYGIVGKPGEIGYSATKGAITAAARSMAAELAKRKIRVNTMSPGLVRTEMTRKALSALSAQQVKDIEKGHLLGTGTPEDVARVAVFLLAPQSSWITGADFVIDGGYTVQ